MAEQEKKAAKKYEQSAEVEQFGDIAHERHEAIRDALERAERKHKAHDSDNEILAEAKQLAKEADKASVDHTASPSTERRHGPITKRQLNASFKSQLQRAQEEMTTSERLLSKIIHTKAVEKSSDFIGSTIARPNAMLSGSIAAFAGITVIYFLSKYYGFQLSGFETIATFIIGWILGVLYDYFSVMIRGHKR